MSIVFPVQSGGWQPVSDDSTITIGTTSGLTASEYLIHFGEHGSDYYVFFNARSEPISISITGTNLTVNSDSVMYIQRVEQDVDDPTKYRVVGSRLTIDTALNSGGFQLTQRYQLGSVISSCAGKSILDVSTYDDSKLACLYNNHAAILEANDFFKKPFTIKTAILTSTIIPNGDILYIIIDSSSDTEVDLDIIPDYESIKDITIGGDTGIIVGDDFGSDKTLTINVELGGDINLHGRTKPIIKFDESSELANLSVNIDSCALDFVEPLSFVKTQALALKIGDSGSPGVVLLEDISAIEFDTTTELTIRETTYRPTLKAPTTNQVFVLNAEAAPSLAKDSVLFSVVNIDKSNPEALTLKPLMLLKGGYDDAGKYGIATKDAVYLVMFKLDEQSGGKWSAAAHVVGKLNNNGVGVATVPTNNLIYLGEADKQQLVYISIGNGTSVLTTNTSMQYVLPYDTNMFRSSDLKAAGIDEWPTQLIFNDIITVGAELSFEFSKGTENMFKTYAPEDIEHTTNIFNTTIDVIDEIYNYLDWFKLGFEMSYGIPVNKPLNITVSGQVIHIYNIDGVILTRDYIDTTSTVNIGQYIQTLTFENIADTWTQFTMSAEPFNLSSDTLFSDSDIGIFNITIKPTTNAIKFTDGSITRYFVMYDTTNYTVVDMPSISGRTATTTLDELATQIYLCELTQTDGDTRVGEYYFSKVCELINNIPNAISVLIIGFSNIYIDNNLQTKFVHLDTYIFSSSKIGRVDLYTTTPTSITTESNTPDYILTLTDIQQRDDLHEFDEMWIIKPLDNTYEITLQGFTPTRTHTIESNPDMTITLTNYVDWTDENRLTLRGGKWIVKDYSSSSPTSITGDNLTLYQPGWENKYLSQLGALTSIQKNLQIIYDSLGGVVKRTLVNGETQYTTTINGFDDNFNKQFFNQLQNMLKHNNEEFLTYLDNWLQDKVYPVGSIYVSYSSNTNPSTILGFGTWIQIEERFLFATGVDITSGNRAGGNYTTTLTINNLPNHDVSGSINTADGGYQYKSYVYKDDDKNTHTIKTRESNVGEDKPVPISIIPPYTRVYMWRREE